MSENENPAGGDKGDKGGYTPPPTQAALDAIIGERLARTRAQYGDYDELKAAATELAEIKASQQTDAQKTAAAITKLQDQLAQTRTEALRSRIQATHQISNEDAALFLTATDEDTLTKQAERLADRAAAERKKTGGRDPFAGRTPSSSEGPNDAKREWLRSVTDRG